MSKKSNEIKFSLTAKKNGETYNGTTELQGSISELGAMLFESSGKDIAVRTVVLLTASVLMKTMDRDDLSVELFKEVYSDDNISDLEKNIEENKTEDYGSFE